MTPLGEGAWTAWTDLAPVSPHHTPYPSCHPLRFRTLHSCNINRRGSLTTSGGHVPSAPAASSSRSAGPSARARVPVAGAPRTASGASAAQLNELKGQVAELQELCAATEKERDFYFDSEWIWACLSPATVATASFGAVYG